MKKRIKVLFIIFGLLLSIVAADFVLAQDFGIAEVDVGIAGSLSSGEDVRVTAGRFIQFALSFLGILAVILVMYAGFLWMSSGGDEEKITKARAILKNGVIGLIIILSAWTITTFILRNIQGNVGSGGGTNIPSRNAGFSISGAGAIGVCAVENIYPQDGQRNIPRNTSIVISFKEELDLSTVCVNDSGASCVCDNNTCNKAKPETLRLFKKDLGDACSSGTCPKISTNVNDIHVSVTSDKKTLVLTPVEYLGSNIEHTSYNFKISKELKKLDGSSIFSTCSVSELEVSFSVSDILDLEPPIVQRGRIFPLPDNEKDLLGLYSPALAAEAELNLVSCPRAYFPATVVSVSPNGPELKMNYKGKINKFKIVVPAEAPTKAQLFNAENDTFLGITDWNLEKEAVFPNYLSIKVDSYVAGDMWEIIIKPEVLADTLRINNTVYTFSDSSVNNNIKVIADCNSASRQSLAQQASNIQAVISGHPEVESSLQGEKIKLKAKILGSNGNNISLDSSGSNFVNLKSFSGGVDMLSESETRDKLDRPRNSAIQFTFDEPVNPITISGKSSEVYDYIRVINLKKDASLAGESCNLDSDCRSYKCDNSLCVANQLDGNFKVSNNYRTVEFLTNEECGVNACGETIYCLPANANLKIEIFAANLKPCSSDSDCAALSPFSSCLASDLGYSTCQNPDKKNYPLANLSKLDGVVDLATNSLDGNRSSFSSGPLDFYNENLVNNQKKDNYTWSFFTSDEIDLTPPKITYISPYQAETKVSPSQDIDIHFDKLMLNSTLTSGSVDIFNGRDTFKHKLINLKTSAPSPFGFWLSSENIDSEPLDGEPDLTIATIKHTPLAESTTFFVQVGSGVKDITQNCFKPSVGPGCSSTNASCCFGSPSMELDRDGNCPF